MTSQTHCAQLGTNVVETPPAPIKPAWTAKSTTSSARSKPFLALSLTARLLEFLLGVGRRHPADPRSLHYQTCRANGLADRGMPRTAQLLVGAAVQVLTQEFENLPAGVALERT